MNTSSPHPVLYTPPPRTHEDEAVLGEIHQMRKKLRYLLRKPTRWEGGLRRSALARAIRGSNSIEGYEEEEEEEEEDAAAAIDGEEPISADERTFLEIRGYRQALGYVLAMGEADSATFDTTEIRGYALHDAEPRPDDVTWPLPQGTDLRQRRAAQRGRLRSPARQRRPDARGSARGQPAQGPG
jgi:hypothetical protein